MSNDDRDDLKDQFWDQIAAYEAKAPQSLVAELERAGVSLPSPDALEDSRLTEKLWEVIIRLAELGTFLHNTDHLSDRQLYTELVDDLLCESTILMPEEADFSFHLDLVGSGSEEDNLLYLKYYADEEDRYAWLAQWPDDPLPEHEDPSYERDRLLPQARPKIDRPIM
jgi:hypothetical protein